VPSFDVVGIQSDGAAVIAGRSEPGAIVALLANGAVVGKGVANKDGEWSIILEAPLAPGDYDMQLKSEQDGKSIGHASKFTSSLNVHYSSGVYNKAFATLASTPGWTARKAFEIFLIANSLYWKAGSTFNEGACGVVQAAKDKGYPHAEVTSAFNVVGVSCDGGTPGGNTGSAKVLTNGVALTGQTVAANGNLQFTVTVPAGASFLAVRTGNGSGDANVYVKAGSTMPTSTSFDASSSAAGNAELALVKAPKAGVYSILVTAGAAVNGLSVIAVAR